MSTFVESLKRLYATGKITEEKLLNLQNAGKITEGEYAYITAGGGSTGGTTDLQAFYDEVTKEVGI